MRIVILSSSVYSESACAVAAHLAESGYVPAAVLALSSLNRKTLRRKLGQWGWRKIAVYAASKTIPRLPEKPHVLNNPYLISLLKRQSGIFRSLAEVGDCYRFPVASSGSHNSRASLARLRAWAPDLLVFAGGDILRKPLLEIPRLGVLNLHLGLLPQIRGMSSPEWSLLTNVPVGVTLHFMDAGIDTGPILRKYEFPHAHQPESLLESLPESLPGSLNDLRDQLVAFGVRKLAEVVAALDHGTLSATPQSALNADTQFFVMHDRLRAHAAQRFAQRRRESSRYALAEIHHG
jgi:hypothetical protein